MLTSETKQKINNCRDYLVGKIPDPKGQIDQITNALIYKFMADQDFLSLDFGGVASFFTGEIEKYSWKNLFETRLTHEERAKLYTEGLEKLSHATHLPELFRDVFKDAYLPFKDANTIVLFLTEINKFDYHHSEELGNAFEYLLSIMGSQGDSGSFRTPRHIIEFLVDVVDPKPGQTIYDPACGTAGFLISAFHHIIENHPHLSVVEKLELYSHISGVDIDPGMAKIARVNLYLHGFKTPNIFEDDTITNPKLWENKFDVILANPPFMTPKGGVKAHEGYTIKATKSEVLFTGYIAEHLKLNGKAGIIVPDGIIFKQEKAYKDLRKMLVENNLLYAVVSLPSGVFQPYSGVKTSILFLDRNLASKTSDILFVKVENDGYDLGAQRREINKNDLPSALEIIKEYKKNISEKQEYIPKDKNILVVPKSRIAEKSEYNLSFETYRPVALVNSNYEMVELGEVCEINPLKNEIKNLKDELEVTFLPMEDLGQGKMYFETKKVKTKGEVYSGYTFFRDNDILLAKVTPCFENGKSGIAKNLINGIGFGSTEYYILRGNENILPDWIYLNISSCYFLNNGKNNMNGTGGLKRLTKDFVKNFKIPLPPLEIQEQIVGEIEKYQKIIDGAKLIVKNYKPGIKIDESWEVVELGEVTKIITGKLNANAMVENGKYPFFTCSKEIYKIDTYSFDDEVLLLSGNNASGNYDVKYYNGKFNAYQRTYIITIKNKNILYFYLKLFLESKLLELKDKSVGGLTKFLTLGVIQQLKIPLPPLEIQEQIVAKIEEEQKMVESAKGLIEIFEKKIKDRIGEVWGENISL